MLYTPDEVFKANSINYEFEFDILIFKQSAAKRDWQNYDRKSNLILVQFNSKKWKVSHSDIRSNDNFFPNDKLIQVIYFD